MAMSMRRVLSVVNFIYRDSLDCGEIAVVVGHYGGEQPDTFVERAVEFYAAGGVLWPPPPKWSEQMTLTGKLPLLRMDTLTRSGSWRRYTLRSRPEWPGLVDESLGVAFLVAEALELVGAEGDQRGFVVGEQLHFLADGISVETQAGFGEVLHACWNMRSLLMPLRRSSAMTT